MYYTAGSLSMQAQYCDHTEQIPRTDTTDSVKKETPEVYCYQLA